jgi:hypothetical protein
MIILVGLFSFLAGLALMALAGYRAHMRLEASEKADLFLYPPNEHARNLRDAVRTQLRGWQQFDYRLGGHPVETVREALTLLEKWSHGHGVWIVQDEKVTLPDGSEIKMDEVAKALDRALVDAYKALNEAAVLVLDYAGSLPPGALEQPGQVLYSKKCAFEQEIVQLETLLGLSPYGNEIAKVSRMELWQRLSSMNDMRRCNLQSDLV